MPLIMHTSIAAYLWAPLRLRLKNQRSDLQKTVSPFKTAWSGPSRIWSALFDNGLARQAAAR